MPACTGACPIDHVQCFAGLDIAGIDTMVDHLLEEAFRHEPRPERQFELEGLQGRAAVATARLSAAMKSRRLQGPKWNNLLRNGAREMTLVWEKHPGHRLMHAAHLLQQPDRSRHHCSPAHGDLAGIADRRRTVGIPVPGLLPGRLPVCRTDAP